MVKSDLGRPASSRSLMGLLITAFLLLALFVSQTEFSRFEYDVFAFVNGLPQAFYPVMLTITHFGDLYVAVAAVAVFWIRHLRQQSIHLVLASVAGFMLVTFFKVLVERPRPFNIFQDVYVPMNESGFGFPSGHTTQATISVIIIAFALGGRWRLMIPIWIVAVGISRMYLGVHGPLDIVGGILLGTIVVLATYKTSLFIHKMLSSKS